MIINDMETKHRNVVTQVIKILPEIDPDSTRMVEWIWANRHMHGKDTRAASITLKDVGEGVFKLIQDKCRGYFETTYSSSEYLRGLKEDPTDRYIDLYVIAVDIKGSTEVDVCVIGNEKEVDEISDFVRSLEVKEDVVEVDTLIGFTSQGPMVSTRKIHLKDIDIPQQEFYPWLQYDLDELTEKFRESRSNILFFIGPPGVGKSSIIRKMLFGLNRENIAMVDNSSLQQDPNLATWVRGYDQDSVIVFEDADLLVAERSEGNAQMSMLLNMTNGIMASNTKVIISTNLPTLKSVDSALLRSGRNFDTLVARLLTPEEVVIARASLDMDPGDFKEGETYTLSEALNCEGTEEVLRRRKKAFGFK